MSRSKGFTVIELVVVLTIICVMTAVTLPMGLGWLADYRFSMAARSLSNAVLMARMRGIENRAIFTITSSQQVTTGPFSSCVGLEFTTNVDHGLSQPIPAVTGLTCPGPTKTPISTTNGDMVMISGLNLTRSMNGGEFEVLAISATDKKKFTVQHTFSSVLGDTVGSDNQGTVRNVTAPGRLRIVPAVSTATPDLTATPDSSAYNQESFKASAFTVKEEAASIVFRYDTDKFEVTFFPGNPPIPSTTLPLDPASAPATNFAEMRFDNHGFPRSTVVGNAAPNPTTINTTILIAEKVPASRKRDARRVQYLISPTGKVNVQAWENLP
jgi:prepilin-type N-terminal cleavage/methylation domain-containing protein